MKHPARALAPLLLAACALSSPADAQDTPPAPDGDAPAQPPAPAGGDDGDDEAGDEDGGDEGAKPGEPEPAVPDAPPPTDEEDAAARAVLTAAADRQGGATLGPPDGRLESFHVVFQRVVLHVQRREADGSVKRVKTDTEEPGLILDWKGGQLRTEWRISGKTPVTRGLWFRPLPDGSGTKEWPWLYDGKTARNLTGSGDAKDREELDRDRTVVKALLDVAVLRNLLHDGSRWKLVEDDAFPGRALLRTPPAGKDGALRLTLWIDPATSDVVGARLPPATRGEATMWYGLEYHPKFPEVKGGAIRFPFKVTVREQREPGGPLEPLMEAHAREASFNDVADAAFVQPGLGGR